MHMAPGYTGLNVRGFSLCPGAGMSLLTEIEFHH